MMDIAITKIGDLKTAYTSHGVDIATASNARLLEQEIYTRIMTILGDWAIWPNIGTALEDLLGKPNTREIAAQGAEMLRTALTFDNISSVIVKTVPINSNEILYICQIYQNAEPYMLYVVLNLVEGVTILDNSSFRN